MQTRKSRPRVEAAPPLRVVARDFDEGPTLVTPPRGVEAPTTPRSAAGTPNVIPFAKPRAIAAMPAQFSPTRPLGDWQKSPGPRSAGNPGAAAPRVLESMMAPAHEAVTTPFVAPSGAAFRIAPVPVHASPIPQMVAPAPVGTPIPPPAILTQPPVPAVAPLGYPVISPQARHKWAAFEKLGLLKPKLDPRKLSRHVVTAYRMLGFSILTIIVIVLVGYIAETTFFYLSDSWIVPMAIAPTDEKVVQLQGQLTERQNVRDRIAADLADADRAIVVQQAFQTEFQKAIQSDLDGRKAALERMHELAAAAATTRQSIRNSNNAYAAASSRRMAQEYAAGLIDRQAMLSGKFQLAQISSSNLTLAERQAEYEVRAADLEAQTRSLEALLANTASDAPMSYDVLKIKEEYERSRLETQKAIGLRDALHSALEREDKLLTSLKGSSYLRALTDHAQVAFVPYGNLHTLDKGTSLYACKVGMVICHKVGTVLDVLPGEVVFKHPKRDKQLRGQMVELQLEDGADATDDVLFVGGRPLLL